MKNLSLILFFTAAAVFSQDKKTLETVAYKVYQSSCQLDFDAIFEETYPKLFDVISREQFKEIFKNSLENEDFVMQLNCIEPNFTFGEIKTIDQQKFSLIEHNNQFQLKYKTQLSENEIENMIGFFKSMYEGGEVTYNTKEQAFIFKIRSSMLAIADDSTNNKWKFINNDKGGSLIKRFFDQEILNTLGIQ